MAGLSLSAAAVMESVTALERATPLLLLDAAGRALFGMSAPRAIALGALDLACSRAVEAWDAAVPRAQAMAARDCAVYLLNTSLGWPHVCAGAPFGLAKRSVARVLTRVEERRGADAALDAWLDDMDALLRGAAAEPRQRELAA